MAIKKLKLKNFKSFRELEIELGRFNVLIGANASGKSNFIQIFQFLRNIVEFGLDNATYMQGGIEYLRNINIGPDEDLLINVISDEEFGVLGKRIKKDLIGIKVYESNYEFVLKFNKRNLGFEIIKDKLILKCNFLIIEELEKKIEEKEKLGAGEIILNRVNGKVNITLKKPKEVQIKEEDIFPSFYKEVKLPQKNLLLEGPFFLIFNINNIFSGISIYDFDPKLPKKATSITGKAVFEEDGSNLSIVLKNIIEKKDKKRKLFNLVKDLLPFIEDLDVEKFADKSLIFKLREKFFKKQYLPSSLISDGTINIIALIIALYFEEKLLTIIEEPERNIHPYLISKAVNMMKDASRNKQIIVTTHNPEIVKFAGLENILIISRDEEGFSIISRPTDKEEVKIFLNNEIGIEELYMQNLLEI